MRVVVTGTSGFVGQHVVRELAAEGHQVSSVGRRRGPADVDFHAADLTGTDIPRFDGATVVHCAAATRDGFAPEVLSTNVALTEGALALSDGPFIHVSSSSVYDLRSPSNNVNPEAADGNYPWLNSYSESKFLSEQLVGESPRSKTVILRPHAVYGKGDNTLAPRLRHAARFGVLPLPGGGRAEHAFTSVENLAQAITLAVESDVEGVHRLNITDASTMSIRSAAAMVLDSRARIVDVPVGVAMAAAHLLSLGASEPRLSRYSVMQLAHNRTYDISGAHDILGFHPEPNSLWKAVAEAPEAVVVQQ